MLIVTLAWRDLMRDRFFLWCNVAVMVGILVPLLVLFGVKNGVYTALIGEMLADPANRQIDTQGNASFDRGDLVAMRDWPEIAFMTPKVRGQFDYMNVRAKGGRRMRPALIIPTGSGDPTLPPETQIDPDQVAVSAQLAAQLDLATGSQLELISQAEGRPKQLVLPVTVAVVLPETAVSGRAVLTPFAMLDLIEAFYDSYSLPDFGIKGTRDLSERVDSYEGVRIYARRLEDLAALQARIERHLSIGTTARTRDVESLLGLGRKLNLALGLTAGLAALGLGAALVLGFWSDVSRKKVVLAGIALLGVPSRQLALFPVVQALITSLFGLTISFMFYLIAGQIAAELFGQGLPGEAGLTRITLPQGLAICTGVLMLVLGAAGVAAWSAQRLDPASVLREGV
ncbi:ABC transporter permease family protein [Sedimentitalea nanhaiensis]|uniref:Putative ABC transport system permease protein n=1 Tax=Sedimentitalea nanhaiensis TaxID=999627 RepID=A0A1I6ZWX6_9RHOB|nr:ABC transporter permease [Sedimentitalea nanhaiensis]SFT67136.1 putative ABC transport system permease protein [Sedimentitalea nanhaiensis]